MLEWETLAAETFEKVMQEISCFQLSSKEMLLRAVANMERLQDWLVIDNYSQALECPFRCDPRDDLRT